MATPAIPVPANAPSAPSTMPSGKGGMLRIVTPQELTQHAKAQEALNKAPEAVVNSLAAYVRKQFELAVRHRKTTSLDDELIDALRAYNGEYPPSKLAEIQQFGGSEIYSRVTSVKCRGATALLRDVYMSTDKPWSLSPTPDPVIPDTITKNIDQLVNIEVTTLNMAGEQIDPEVAQERKEKLYDAAKRAERVKARRESIEAERKLDDILYQGRFYEAFNEFLADLPVYNYACIKGPFVRRTTKLRWQNGEATVQEEPTFFWARVSPFDVWFSPGATSMQNTASFERQRITSQELYDLIGLPGYREEEIREIIRRYGDGGFVEWGILFDSERKRLEKRDVFGDEPFIDMVEFNGYILGKHLKDFNIKGVEDDEKPYFVTLWQVDRHVIKVMMNPNPRRRVPYYVTSYDKRPGSIAGDGIPELVGDVQDVMNATLRSLVNNMSIASGPQVVYDEDLLATTQDDRLYPWKRWKYQYDPQNPNRTPVSFFQPNSNAQELLGVYEKFSQMADEVSAIPRYLTGSSAAGGAGRTASGLAMLMNNANKTLQNVAENIDMDVMQPCLENLYDMVMLTDDTGMLRGDEEIIVSGVRNVAKQEQDRVRQLEFLALTANPIDAPIVGPHRASILQQVANRLGLDIELPKPGEEGPPPPPAVQPATATGGGAGFNPAGGPTPNPTVQDGGTPRLQSQPSVNTVSRRGNIV